MLFQNIFWNRKHLINQLRFLRFFTFVSWGILPSTNLVDCADNCYTSLFLSSFSITSFWNLKSVFICSSSSFLCSFLQSVLSILLFFSILLSIPCSVLSLCLFTLFSDLPYCFLFKSVIFSFIFSYYSILPASPLCSIIIQSVLFLLFFIFLDPFT